MSNESEATIKELGFCEHGNRPPCLKCTEATRIQSTREYVPPPAIQALTVERKVIEQEIRPETKVLLIGDGQGADTELFLKMGVEAGNISSVNYERSEVEFG